MSISSRDLIIRCGQDPDEPLGRISFPMEMRQRVPTCCTGWKQVTDDCPMCGPDGPCQEEPDRVRPSLWRRLRRALARSITPDQKSQA